MRIVIPRSLGFILGRTMDVIAFLLRPIKTIHPSFTHFRVKLITANRYFNISKAKTLLGYKPIVGMEEALERTVAWWKPEYAAAMADDNAKQA